MNTSSFNSFEAYQRQVSMEQRINYQPQTQDKPGDLAQNFKTKLQLNSTQKHDVPANLNEIRHDGPKGLGVQQLMTGGRKTPQHQQYFASTMNSLDQRVAFRKKESRPVLMPEIIQTSTVTTATKHLALEQFSQIQAHIQRRGFESLKERQFESVNDAPRLEFQSCFIQSRDKENRNEQVFRNFGGQDDQIWLRKQTMEAQDQFRALAQACKEDFSMPTYMHQSSHLSQVKHSVIGQGPNLNNNIYNESPFEHSVPTNRDSKTLASNQKTDGQFPFSFGTFSMVTSAGISQVDHLLKNSNLPQNFGEKDLNWSAANNARCAQNPFLSQVEQKSRRLTEIQKGPQLNKKKYKASLGPCNARNSNSLNEGRFSNTSTSSCGSITKSNKTIRKNKQKINIKRRESMPSQGAVSETRQILVKNNKIKFQGGSLNRRSQLDKGYKAIAGKRFIAQQPQLDCGGQDDEPKAENDMDDDQVFGIAREDSLQSSQGLFVGAGLHFGNSQEDEVMVDQKWLQCDSSDDELIKPTNTNKFQLDPENGGGRIHRLHNVSRIAHLKNGKEGLKSCVIDLFGCRQQRSEDFDESNIIESDQKSLPFSRISEEKLEESPPQHSSITQHMRTGSSASNTNGFKLKPRNCGAPYHEQYSSGRMRAINFDCNQNSDIRLNTKSSKSSTQRKSQNEASNRKANRPNFHNSSRTTPFDQQQRTHDVVMAQDDKMRSLVLNEVEPDQEEDVIDFSLLQADDKAKFLELQPFDNNTQLNHNVIKTETLANFITEGAVVDGNKRRYIIVDCRFPFEFQGGHIKGAINICTPDDLESSFFEDPTTIQSHLANQTILIFHCEHSQNRAPNMLFSMRNLDRHMNRDRYPKIFYPESYLLEGGYQKFYNEFPHLCKDKYVQGSQGGDVFEQMMHCTIKKQKSYNARDKALNLIKQKSFNMAQKHPASTQIIIHQPMQHKKMRSETRPLNPV